jgi:hypothetical protein
VDYTPRQKAGADRIDFESSFAKIISNKERPVESKNFLYETPKRLSSQEKSPFTIVSKSA